MASNFEEIKKIEEKAKKIISNAHLESQKIKLKVVEKVQENQLNSDLEIEKRSRQINNEAIEKSLIEAQNLIQNAEKESRLLREKMEANLDKASKLIVKRILGGSSEN